MSKDKLPVLFISHGGGPWPWIPEMKKQFQITEKNLSQIGEEIKPRAVLVISGHWEEDIYSVATSEKPGMIYDYSGFPPHTYHITYDAPGSPEISQKVKELLEKENIVVKEDPKRGYDHGTFVPLYCMYPEANIPVAQLSLNRNYSPEEHYRIGELLRPLRSEGILIIGSGLSYHNLKEMFRGDGEKVSIVFEEWLTAAVESPPSLRKKNLIEWEKAPFARDAHPEEDHLMPLMVIAGAAGEDRGHRLFLDKAFNVRVASYRFDSSE